MSWLYTPEKTKKYFCILNVIVEVNPTCMLNQGFKTNCRGITLHRNIFRIFLPRNRIPKPWFKELKRALTNSQDKSSTVYIISLSSPCHRARHSTVHSISMSSPFHCPCHFCILAGSFAVRCGDHLRYWDHLQSNLGIICSRGSFAALYRYLVLCITLRVVFNMLRQNF